MSHSIISFKNKYIRSKDYKIVTLLFLAVVEIDRRNQKLINDRSYFKKTRPKKIT